MLNQRLFDVLMALFLPPACFVCDHFSSTPLCKTCENGIVIQPQVCRDIPHLDAVWSFCGYDGTVKAALAALKFYGVKKIAHQLSELIVSSQMLGPLEDDKIDVVPVPIHRKRLRDRGFNQVLPLFDAWLSFYGLGVQDYVRRRKRTTSLFRLGRRGRQAELLNVFELASPCVSETVIVLDDILTTGTTLQEMAVLLRSAGAKAVYGITLAYAR